MQLKKISFMMLSYNFNGLINIKMVVKINALIVHSEI